MALTQAQAQTEYDQLANLFNAGRYVELENQSRLRIERHPESGQAWKLLGAALQMQGKEALNALQMATRLLPDDAEAHFNLGVMLIILGKLPDAVTQMRRVLEIRPDYADAHYNLGGALKNLGQLNDALTSCRRALALKPDYAEAHHCAGNILMDLGQREEAAAHYGRALEIRPDDAESHSNLGNALRLLGQLDSAVACQRRALEIKPDFAGAHNNLGNALKDLGQLDSAVQSYRRALALNPNFAMAHNNLGGALQDLGQLDAAVASFSRALAIKPGYVEACNNLGIAYKKLGQLDQAEMNCRRALEISPEYSDACNNLGEILKDAGRLDEAIDCYRRAVALDPGNPGNPGNTRHHSNLVYSVSFHPAFDDRRILAEAKQFASSHRQTKPFPSAREPGRRLRIGYVSPDFRNHCQSLFTTPLLSNHDHTQFEIHCYADLLRPDAISERLMTFADQWRPTHSKSDAQVAEMIANDGIDILVDLTMHMANGRPLLFARKPAPVQVAWLAYPGTTGIPEIDYRLTDPWLDPPELGDNRYSEKSFRLPDTFWCYDPLVSGLQPNPLPALMAGHVTFGCLNNFCKVSDDTLCRWGQVMARLPSSRLILMAAAGQHRQRVFNLLGRYGIGADRIEFVEYLPQTHYLQTYHRIDICLDTLPYNGHTTSLDAFWMGVPVVTQIGHTVVGRAGWSQLNNLGLPELAASDEQSFIDIAVALASDLHRLSQLRKNLRGQMETSPLMDGKRFAAAIENTFRQIHGEVAVGG